MKKFFPALVLSLLSLVCGRAMAQAQPAELSPAPAAMPASAPQAPGAAEPAAPEAVSTRLFALAPIFASQTYSAENRAARTGAGMMFGFIGAMVSLGVERDRRAQIKALVEMELSLHTELMDALKAEFKGSNQDMFDLESPKYYPGEPESLDFKASGSKSDWILTANIFDVGVSSSFISGKFVPRLNVSFYVTNRQTEETVYDASIYYGADAKKPAPDQIPVDPSLGFDTFDDIMGARRAEFVQALRSGVSSLAKAVAAQVGQVKLDTKKS